MQNIIWIYENIDRKSNTMSSDWNWYFKAFTFLEIPRNKKQWSQELNMFLLDNS